MTDIKQAGDLYDRTADGIPYEDATTIIEINRAAGETIPDPEPEQGGDPAVTAYVNWGRWVGDCRLDDPATGMVCANAQAIDPADERFFCVACLNADVGGRWRPVVWPADQAAVETPLVELPVNEQNWVP